MGSHPINLAVRFILEVAGLLALAWMGWHYGRGLYRYLLAIGIPLLAAILWGVFAVPDDPSRSGDAVVAIPGMLRLILELAYFAAAAWSFFAVGAATVGWIYVTAVIVHYLVSIDRVLWLIQQ
jgi:hypothetical protein